MPRVRRALLPVPPALLVMLAMPVMPVTPAMVVMAVILVMSVPMVLRPLLPTTPSAARSVRNAVLAVRRVLVLEPMALSAVRLMRRTAEPGLRAMLLRRAMVPAPVPVRRDASAVRCGPRRRRFGAEGPVAVGCRRSGGYRSSGRARFAAGGGCGARRLSRLSRLSWLSRYGWPGPHAGRCSAASCAASRARPAQPARLTRCARRQGSLGDDGAVRVDRYAPASRGLGDGSRDRVPEGSGAMRQMGDDRSPGLFRSRFAQVRLDAFENDVRVALSAQQDLSLRPFCCGAHVRVLRGERYR